MYYWYGTSGFRYHHLEIEKIAKKIGLSIGYLICKNSENYGIMITASHNHFEDNGVKIINQQGEMVDDEIEVLMEKYVNSNESVIKTLPYTVDDKNIGTNKLIIGYDSRFSSPSICNSIKEGCNEINPNIVIEVIPHITTPQLHFELTPIIKEISYGQFVQNCLNEVNFPCILDCANGIGANTLSSLKKPSSLKLINTSWYIPQLLNQHCSSDYVCKEKTLPVTCYPEDRNNKLCASLDGDGDRVVFYIDHDSGFHLFNGDYISALLFTYIHKQLQESSEGIWKSEKLHIGFLYTGYTNDACIQYISSLFSSNQNIEFEGICCKTGIKNLQKKAKNYDISIYFEQNGHGNLELHKDIPCLNYLVSFFHPTIGDGILDCLAVLYMLEDLQMEIMEWKHLYISNKSKMGKVKVENKHIFLSNENETVLLEPVECQEFIENLTKKSNNKILVRASGTENIVRVYVEGKHEELIENDYNQIVTFLENNYSLSKISFHENKFISKRLCPSEIDEEYIRLLGMLSTIDPYSINIDKCKQFVKGLTTNHQIIVFQEKETGKLVASGTLFIEEKIIHNLGKVGHIEDIVVHQFYRKFGLGKKMIHLLTKCSEKEGCYKTILDCSEENVGFYEKCGYEKKGIQMAKYV